ncbi:efflux RND transporter permease subunit [Thalassomonas actiniarum]|uniref:Efflux RND transporter permease subunit n=1 Tax=Thalassomonas actiniarum TaxID=485447 RepID=A0AAE9YP11_9GAMM|nr:efflux RND transporter permease subunit [Thalassomonas actiniarum]WDD98614.1 efflux RND transporter permease subunit [Thalassomonas actiniarum]
MTDVNKPQGIIAWFAGNSVAANLLMLAIIFLGIMSFNQLRKEAFPPWPTDSITVSMTYDSGDAKLSEEGIAIKIEEALANVQGIKRISSTSNASGSRVTVEALSGYDLDILLRDVKAKVDAIYNFPGDAEKPVIDKQSRLQHAYSVKIFGDSDRSALQAVAERLKVDLLAQAAISNVEIKGKAEPMMSIELDEQKLQAYQLSFSDIANIVNNESSTAISTSLRNENKVVRLKVAEQAYRQKEFANIPLVTLADGSQIKLGDVAKIEDDFADDVFVVGRYNGKPGIGVEIKVDEHGDVLKIVEQAELVVAKWQESALLPQNMTMETWDDGGTLIRDRLALLIKNALSGIALVFLVLALFLNLRVAFWVTAGLPFIFCGTLFFMTDSFTGMTINEMTTFGFILALGIVVDDAVVVGESIYATRKSQGDSLNSTIAGTQKVAVPTIFGVLTTVATFIALANVEGGMGHVYSQFAVIVTICLLLSVVESKLILPSHLAHLNTRREVKPGLANLWPRLQAKADSGLQWFNDKLYKPTIEKAISYRYGVMFVFIAVFILVIGMPQNGGVRVAFFPDIPGSVIQADMSMQNDASFGQTRKNLSFIERAAISADEQLAAEHNWQGSAIDTIEVIGESDLSGTIVVELTDSAPYGLNEFARVWKTIAQKPEGVRKLDIRSGFGGRDNFKVELKAWNTDTIREAGQEIKGAISQIAGVSGIDDNFDSGQAQLRFTLTEQGLSLGLTTQGLSRQVLQAFGGEIVQRYQRGKDEVKVRIRYPESERQTVNDVMKANIRLDNGQVVPLAVVAKVTSEYQQNEMTRISGLPAVYVSARVDKDIISSNELVSELKKSLIPALESRYPDLAIHFAGEAEQQQETASSMTRLFIMAMAAIYILLAIPLRSYVQPLIIMTAIPFGLVGAILGHWLNDMVLSILSFNGIVALSGVVVNDSLLLVSRFNYLKAKKEKITDAIVLACTGRLRAVLLTSITTYAGLMPLLSETSAQAQFIIPAAASLGYGILFATLITLILVPSLLMMHQDAIALLQKLKHKLTGQHSQEKGLNEHQHTAG